mmetsp:Transcript_7017/g.24953  ORF Transcript_7017/g.24953 Transcript_7017/m.24953 type:complete len:371 (-) Transcript_7017:359-1471(-)
MATLSSRVGRASTATRPFACRRSGGWPTTCAAPSSSRRRATTARASSPVARKPTSSRRRTATAAPTSCAACSSGTKGTIRSPGRMCWVSRSTRRAALCASTTSPTSSWIRSWTSGSACRTSQARGCTRASTRARAWRPTPALAPMGGPVTTATRLCAATSTTTSSRSPASTTASVPTVTTAPASSRPPSCTTSTRTSPRPSLASRARIAPSPSALKASMILSAWTCRRSTTACRRAARAATAAPTAATAPGLTFARAPTSGRVTTAARPCARRQPTQSPCFTWTRWTQPRSKISSWTRAGSRSWRSTTVRWSARATAPRRIRARACARIERGWMRTTSLSSCRGSIPSNESCRQDTSSASQTASTVTRAR